MRNKMKLICGSLFILGFLIMACATTKGTDIKKPERIAETVEVFKEIEKPKLNIEKPKPLELSKPRWYIIAPEISDKVFKELSKNNNDPVLYGLSESGYENLSKDMEKILQHIEMLNEMIDQYKKYYESETKETKSNGSGVTLN